MIDELIKELNELYKYKERYEYAMKDKKILSDMLLEYMNKEYSNQTYEKRCELYEKEICKCCRYNNCCDLLLPQDILKPIPSDKGWVPSKISCGKFEWS